MVSDGADPKVSLSARADAAARRCAERRRTARRRWSSRIELGPARRPADDRLRHGPRARQEGRGRRRLARRQRSRRRRRPSSRWGSCRRACDKDIATLQGTELRVKVTPDGRESDSWSQLEQDREARPRRRLVAERGRGARLRDGPAAAQAGRGRRAVDCRDAHAALGRRRDRLPRLPGEEHRRQPACTSRST